MLFYPAGGIGFMHKKFLFFAKIEGGIFPENSPPPNLTRKLFLIDILLVKFDPASVVN